MRGVSLLIAVTLAAAQAPTPTVPDLPGVNPEILTLVVQDQWDRGVDMFVSKGESRAKWLAAAT